MVNVFSPPGLGEDKDIVQEDKNKSIQHVSEHIVHID